MLAAYSVKSSETTEELKAIQEERRELEKERVRLRDERNEYRKMIREEARKENYASMIKKIIQEETKPINLPVHYTLYNSDVDLLCHLTDIHAGIKISTYKNIFDENVLLERIQKYVSNIIDIQGLHQAQNCYLVIGEILSGIIHNTLRIQNNLDLIEQFKYISEIISSMLVRLAGHFNHIYVYITPGNHSRITPKKEDSLAGENMDILLPFYLKARLQNIENVSIMENEIQPDIASFLVRNSYVMASHGDKDTPENVVQNYTMMYGIKPDIVLLGHRHTNGLKTVYDTKVIQSGCVSGTDEYTTSLRKSNKPEQTVSVIGDMGLICLYDIQLN